VEDRGGDGEDDDNDKILSFILDTSVFILAILSSSATID